MYQLVDYVESSGAGIYLNCITSKEKKKWGKKGNVDLST
jgi:hypothetical protein